MSKYIIYNIKYINMQNNIEIQTLITRVRILKAFAFFPVVLKRNYVCNKFDLYYLE
jgi:hypothetical protein